MNEAELFQKAHEAGMAAGNAVSPDPMVVVGDGQRYVVSDGVCGFSWIKVRPASGKFVGYCKAINAGHKSYSGGYDIWVSEFGQSMQRKEAYAEAFARVLRENGLKAYADSRMD